jgi:hypothetical protein
MEVDMVKINEEKSSIFCVTPFSKYLAMILFILMPFIGGWVGYTYAPEKIIEVEKVVVVHDVQKIAVPEQKFVAGEKLDFIGKVRTIDQYCEEPGFCRPYTAVSLPDTLKSERIFDARIEGGTCVGSSIRIDDTVRVTGEIFYADDDIGLILYCEQGVVVSLVTSG